MPEEAEEATPLLNFRRSRNGRFMPGLHVGLQRFPSLLNPSAVRFCPEHFALVLGLGVGAPCCFLADGAVGCEGGALCIRAVLEFGVLSRVRSASGACLRLFER
eukprot:5269953-Pleurochrysis_carterae.AAC.5